MGESDTDAPSDALRCMLRDDETLLWRYRPPRGLFLRQSLVGIVIGGLIVWTIFYGMFVGIPVLVDFGDRVEAIVGMGAPEALALGWLAVQATWIFCATLASLRAYGRIEYAATDRRAIQLGGVIGLDTSAIAWEDVRDVEVVRNVIANRFGTGTVRLRTAGGGGSYRGDGVTFRVVEDPTGAVESLEEIRHGRYDGPAIEVGRRGPDPASDGRLAVDTGTLSAPASRVLREAERVVWHGRPSVWPFVAGHLALGGAAVALAMAIVRYYPDWLFFALVGIAGVHRAARRVLRYRNAEYVATTERVVQFDGAIGRDFSSVAWKDVEDLEVATGPIDGAFGTGTLRFSRAGRATAHERSLEGDGDGPAFAGVTFDPHAVAEHLEAVRTAT